MRITIEANKKIINYLDITFYLDTGKHEPYIKPGNKPQYTNVQSNHPPTIIKAVPDGINKRLSQISSDEASFNKPIYQEALNRSGYKYQLNSQKTP